jgi:S-adenosyl-L-methionine hydrolase (adenosine-forming)
MSRPISFLSDFGLDDEFVGVVHGVIARIDPAARVIDVTHGVPRGDVRAGALTLLRAVQYLPEGVVLAVVDPGVGTERRAIAVRTGWGHFVGPDNGLLAPAVAMVGGADRIVSLENPEFHVPGRGGTFDGRDVFAPAAAVLADDQASIDDLGPVIDGSTVTPLLLPLTDPVPGRVTGEVLWVDRFGNAQTNVTPDDMTVAGFTPGEEVVVRVGGSVGVVRWVAAYGHAGSGEALVHEDSYGQMAVAVRDGRADEAIPLAAGVAVTFESPDRGADRGGGGTPVEFRNPTPPTG